MTSSPPDLAAPERGRDPSPIIARTRVVVRARNLALVALAATIIAAWILYNQPAHSYQVGANATTWSTDVTTALAKRPSGGNFVPTGALRTLPGVGTVVEVIVDKAKPGKGTAVLFLTGLDSDYAGLVYLDGFPPPQDSCNFHLGGPWWEVTPINDTSMSCPRGYHDSGGG